MNWSPALSFLNLKSRVKTGSAASPGGIRHRDFEIPGGGAADMSKRSI